MDHPFLALAVLCHCWRSTNSTSKTLLDVLHQRYLPRSRGSLSQLLSWSSLLVLPPFQDVIRSLRAPRRFWAAPREQGFWEKDVCLLWRNMGKIYPDWEQNCYLQHFRMSKDTFWYLYQTYGKYFEKATAQLRQPLVPAKRIAIVIALIVVFKNWQHCMPLASQQ